MPAYIHHHDDIEPAFVICPSCVGLPMFVRDVEPHWSMAKIDFTYECADCGAEVRQTIVKPQLRLDHGLANFGATIGAFIGEVDLRHAPMRLHVPDEHRKPDAARTDDEGRFGVVVMMDIGWHVGSPQEDTQESIHQ